MKSMTQLKKMQQTFSCLQCTVQRIRRLTGQQNASHASVASRFGDQYSKVKFTSTSVCLSLVEASRDEWKKLVKHLGREREGRTGRYQKFEMRRQTVFEEGKGAFPTRASHILKDRR